MKRLRVAFAAATLGAVIGCGGATPVTPSPPPPSLATATSVPATESASASAAVPLGWRRLASFPLPRHLIGIAASEAGYVVMSYPRTAWFSVDGRAWTSSELPFRPATSRTVELQVGLDDGTELEATVNAIAGGPGGFLAVGSYSLPPCTGQFTPGGPPRCEILPVSWVSTDGRTWRSSIGTPVPADGSGLPRYSELARAWPAAGGWDAAVSVLADTPVHRGNGLLHSSDGLTWTRLAPAPLPDGAASGDDVYAHDGVATTNGRRLTWQVMHDGYGVPTAALATSADGNTWTRVDGFEGAGVEVTFGLAPAVKDDPWWLAGYVVAGENVSVKSWRSDDLATWTMTSLPVAPGNRDGLWALGRWAGLDIILGRASETSSSAGSWTTGDGMTWEAGTGSPRFMTAGPAGLVGAVDAEDGTATIWIGVRSPT